MFIQNKRKLHYNEQWNGLLWISSKKWRLEYSKFEIRSSSRRLAMRAGARRGCRLVSQFCCCGCGAWLPGNALTHAGVQWCCSAEPSWKAISLITTVRRVSCADANRPTDPLQWNEWPDHGIYGLRTNMRLYRDDPERYINTHVLNSNTTIEHLFKFSHVCRFFSVFHLNVSFSYLVCARLASLVYSIFIGLV